MPTKRISADEAIAKRKDHIRETDKGMAIIKAAKAPPSWDKQTRSARFVMNAQATDRYGDIVVTEGIDTTQFEKNPVALLFHSSRTWPVGSWGNLEKVLKGRPPRLEGDVTLLPEGGPVKEIDECAWMIENGGIRACSIGFVPDWDETEMILDDEGKPTWGYKFNACELVEASIVSIPASPQSLIKDAGGNMRLAKELIEDILDNWAKSPEGLLLPRAEFESSYRIVADKIVADKAAAVKVIRFGDGVDEEKDMDEDDKSAEDAENKAGTDDVSRNAPDTVVLTDDILKAFAEQGGPDDALVLINDMEDGETKLAFEREGKQVAELVLPDDITLADAKAAYKSVAEMATAANDTLVIDVDTSVVDEKLNKTLSLAERVSGALSRIFKGDEAEERQEPTFDPPSPAAEEAVAAARARAAEVRTRLIEKGHLKEAA